MEDITVNLVSIKKTICEHYGINISKLNEYNRMRTVVEPRQLYHYFSRKYTNCSLQEIGSPFDHATVLNSVKVVNNRLETEKPFNKLVETIQIQIENLYFKKIGKGGLRSLARFKQNLINEIYKSDDYFEIQKIMSKTTLKIMTLINLKNEFEIELNKNSPESFWDDRYIIAGESRNVDYYGSYGTALKTFDENLFNRKFAEWLTPSLQVSNLEVVVENIAV